MYFVMKMAKQFSKKTTILTILGIAATLLMGACLLPTDIDDFLRDDEVQEIIRRGLVDLYDRTESGNLRAGNERIIGLSPDNYYLVKVLSERTNPTEAIAILTLQQDILGDIEDILSEGNYDYEGFEQEGFWLVSRTGRLLREGVGVGLAPLGRVSGGAIIGLYNNLTYIVWNALALEGYVTVRLDCYDGLPGEPTLMPIINGRIELSPPPTDYSFIMNPSPDHEKPAITVAGNYTIVRVPVIPDANTSTISHSPSGTSALLPLLEAPEVDYVFIEYDYNDNVISFRVLRVTMDVPLRGGIAVDLTFAAPDDNSPTPAYHAISVTLGLGGWEITPGGGRSIVIEINNADLFGSFRWWAFDPFNPTSGTEVELGNEYAFYLNFRDESPHAYLFTVPGIHHLNIEAIKEDGRKYSGTVIITAQNG